MRDRLAAAVLVMGVLFVVAGVFSLVRERVGSDLEISTTEDTTASRLPTSQPESPSTAGAQLPVADAPVVTVPSAPSSTARATAPTSSAAPTVPSPVDAGDEPNETPPAGPAIDPDDPEAESDPRNATASVAGFFEFYVAAIDAGDVDFLYNTLHPLVLEQPTAGLCRAFIEREILALRNYRTAGEIGESTAQDVAGTIVAELYSIPVAFEFQGQTFEGTASFAPVDGLMRWFTTCR